MIKWICFLGFFVFTRYLHSQNQASELKTKWYFKSTDSVNWLPAKVPGNVILDLQQNKIISDPYYSDNSANLRWVENANWEYKTEFYQDKTRQKYEHVELTFNGLDTYASVYLNNTLILEATNMFRSWKVDIKKLLKDGKNEIRVKFLSPLSVAKKEYEQLNYMLPEIERVFTRRAQFQYGWDFSPRLLSCGIWKDVELHFWNHAQIQSVNYITRKITDSLALVDFVLETNCETVGNYKLDVNLNSPDTDKQLVQAQYNLNLKAGFNSDTFHIRIPHPKLWWSNESGAPDLYTAGFSFTKNNSLIEKRELAIGIRSLELVQHADSVGKSFYFKLNGKRVFMKGANYVPHDALLRQRSLSEIETELHAFKLKHINMLRIWGGGVYPDENFYTACDRLGILIWQDFMFAGAMYPGDTNFIQNVKEEVKQQIYTFRHHPSLAIWCGNNEIDEAWHNWGWQKQYKYSYGDSAKIWNDYVNLFENEIPKMVHTYDSERFYWPSSPSIGWGRKESLKSGDAHYWGVWWGMQPFEMYQQKSGRFMTEYGFQSFPSMSTLKINCKDADLHLGSVCFAAHQKHKTGFETIQHYLEMYYRPTTDLQSYIYLTQLLQRDGMRVAISTHRSNKPTCMGTLFWQLNDSWPGITWSAIDYHARPKALFYDLSKLYATCFVNVTETETDYVITVVSDSIQTVSAKVFISLQDFQSIELWQQNYLVQLTANTSEKIRIAKSQLPKIDSTQHYFKLELVSSGKILADNFHFFSVPKHLALRPVTLKVQSLTEEEIEITANTFTRDVYLYSELNELKFSDNFFNLEAGEKKRIKIQHPKNLKGKVEIKNMALNNIYTQH